MSVPGLVEAALGDESVAATVDLGNDDTLYVSPTRTLVYRSEGLLSDESIEEFPHGAERVTVSEGRRKSSIELDYGLDGTRKLSVPASRLEDVLHTTLAGVLNAAGVTEPGETVLETYRFSDLTIVITSNRLVKHIGAAVWDEEYEEFHYGDVEDLDFEDGSVAMQVVLTTADRQERFKAPNQEARAVRERLEGAILDYHGIDSIDDLRPDKSEESETEPATATTASTAIGFDETVEPLVEPDPPPPEESSVDDTPDETRTSASPAEGASGTDATSDTPSADSTMADAGFEPAATDHDAEILQRLDDLQTTVERQTELLESQGELIERLIEELRRRQ